MKREFAIFLVLLALVMSVASVSAATTRTVATDCTGQPTPCYTTIQAAINDSILGDTININDGTYNEVLSISTDDLTIVGNSEAGVIINANTAGYHLFVDADNIHLERFTLNSTGASHGTYGIKAQGVVPTKAANLTIIDVTVNDTKNTGVDLNGIDGVTLTNITVNDVTSGNGVAMTDVDNAILTNITTSGNAWGGVAIYTGGGWFPGGSDNVTLININGSETNPLYIELGPDGAPLPVTNLTLPVEYLYTVTNSEHRLNVDGSNFTFYQKTLADAVILGDGLNFPADNYPFAANEASIITRISDGALIVESPLTIQAAVDAASPGDTIEIGPGTYVEQVVIDKDLVLVGDVFGGTIIQPDSPLAECFTTGTNSNCPIVYIKDGADVDLSYLTVDGLGLGNANYRFQGIGYRNAGGSVDNATITGVRDTPFSGLQHGVALYVYNDDGGTYSMDVTNSTFVDFQKNAMALNCGGVGTIFTVNVANNVITGAGPTGVTAQNGVQVGEYDTCTLTGTISENDIYGIGYTGSGWVASSILNWWADVDITDNNIFGAQLGVYNYDGDGEISGNKIQVKQIGDSSTGIFASDPPGAVPSPFADEAEELESVSALAEPNAVTVVQNVDILNNTVTFVGPDNTNAYGIRAYAGYSANDLNITANGNTVSGFEYGFVFQECASGCAGGAYTSIVANNNSIVNNGFGMYADTSIVVDGTNNWWGDPSGPFNAATNPGGLGDEVSDVDEVIFDPWLTATTIIVTPSDVAPSATSGAWYRANEQGGGTSNITNAQPDTLGGLGSLEQYLPVSGSPSPKTDFQYLSSDTTGGFGKVMDRSEISFEWYRDSSSTALALNGQAFRVFVYDPNWSDGPSYFLLVWEPTYNGYGAAVPTDTWNADDITNGNFWRIPQYINGVWKGGSGCALGAGPVTDWSTCYVFDNNLDEWNFSPDATIVGMNVGLGSGWSGSYLGYTDLVTLGFTGGGTTTWDFEYITRLETDPDDKLVVCGANETVEIKLADVEDLFGYNIEFTYDESVVTVDNAEFDDSWFDTTTNAIVVPGWDAACSGGTCRFAAYKTIPATPLDGSGTVATIEFAPAATGFTHLELIPSTFVLTDEDGFQIDAEWPDAPVEISVCGTASVSGAVELQGRLTPHDAGTVTLIDTAGDYPDITVPFSGVDGSYSIPSVPVNSYGSDYRFEAAHLLYLGNEIDDDPVTLDPGDAYVPYTTQLRGGDANNDGKVFTGDASCIGAVYLVGGTCGGTGSTDINDDGLTNIQDLAIVGSNYTKATWQPWQPSP